MEPLPGIIHNSFFLGWSAPLKIAPPFVSPHQKPKNLPIPPLQKKCY